MPLPITGRIDLGGMAYPCPSGMEFTIAVDGTFHVLARTGADDFLVLSCADTLTYASTTIDFATFKADVTAELGLTDGGSPTQFISADERVNVRGTPYVVILGDKERNAGGGYEVYNIIYRVLAEGSIEIAFVQHYLSNSAVLDFGGWGGGLGVLTARDGEYFYYLGAFTTGFLTQLVKIPIDDEIDLTANSFASKRWDLPAGDMTSTGWWATSSRDPKNHATLWEIEPDLIGILAYKTTHEGETEGTLWQTVIDTASIAPGSGGTGKNDISATFNIPWADEGFDFDGNPSVAGDDKYTNPSINDLPNGQIEVIFGRGDSALPGRIGFRRFVCNRDLTGVTGGELVWVDIGSALGVTGTEAVHFERVGNFLIPMIRENPALTFGTIEVSVGACESSGFDLQYPPCVTAWTQCVKIQRRDGVTFRFTTLDQDIEFRGETYVTCGSLDPSATQTHAQLGEVGSSELAGLITTTGIEEAELYGGLFDDAFVEIWLVPFDASDNLSSGDGDLPRRLAAGWAGKVSHSTRGYKMEVLGPGARLDQRPIVQVYSPQCRWVFGDERCTIDIDSMAIAGSVTSAINRGSIIAILSDPLSSGTGAPESSGTLPAQFANGRVRWLTGVNAGQVTEVKSVDFDTGQIILWALTCFVPEVGDTFDLLPGCAQDFATCQDVYDNVLNFGGFPDVPGRDAITEAPDVKQA